MRLSLLKEEKLVLYRVQNNEYFGAMTICSFPESRTKKCVLRRLFVVVIKPCLEMKTFCWYFGKRFIKNGFGDHKSAFVHRFNSRAKLCVLC